VFSRMPTRLAAGNGPRPLQCHHSSWQPSSRRYGAHRTQGSRAHRSLPPPDRRASRDSTLRPTERQSNYSNVESARIRGPSGQTIFRGEVQVLKWLVQDPGDAFPGIEFRPGVCGGEARIVRTRIPVWLLKNARRSGVTEQVSLGRIPALRAEDLVNAWNYARSLASEMDRQIHETT
jgi:uncharacterized protein (DUF433 family)